MANVSFGKTTSELKTNSQFTRQTFGISDISIVMELLSKLYSNPIRTLTQEYISNARDANREAKTTKPVQITFPSKFSPVIKIRDFGLGLSPERVEKVFLFYGASTKRDTNEQTGGFGIGSKSAFAYTDSFTIITYVDGIRREYLAHKSGGQGNLDLITEEHTKEPNGTSIEIAVNPYDISSFKKAILRTTFFWKKEEKPEFINYDNSYEENQQLLFEVNDKHFIYKNLPDYINYDSLLVVDGIPYEIQDYYKLDINEYMKLIYYGSQDVFFLNTGDIKIAPNRESYVINETSKKYIEGLHKKSAEILSEFKEKKESKAKTIKEKLQFYKDYREVFSFSNKIGEYNIRGSVLRNKAWHKSFCYTVHNNISIKKEQSDNVKINNIGKNIYYIDQKESHSIINRRIATIFEETSASDIDVLKPETDKQVIKDLQAIKLSNYEPMEVKKYPKAYSRKGGVKKEEITLHKVSYKDWPKSKFVGTPEKHKIADIDFKVIYIPMSHEFYGKKDYIYDKGELGYFCAKENLYFIADSKINSIKNNKYFVHIDTFLKNYKLSKDEKNNILKQITGYSKYSGFYKVLDPNKIRDKDLSAIIKLYNTDVSYGHLTIPESLSKNFKKTATYIKHEKYITEINKRFKEKYQLLENMNYIPKENIKEITDYINWKYVQRSK